MTENPKTEYHVISEGDPLTLSIQVDQLLQTGWQLVGGVAVAMHEDSDGIRYVIYAQAMIKLPPFAYYGPLGQSSSKIDPDMFLQNFLKE